MLVIMTIPPLLLPEVCAYNGQADGVRREVLAQARMHTTTAQHITAQGPLSIPRPFRMFFNRVQMLYELVLCPISFPLPSYLPSYIHIYIRMSLKKTMIIK